MSVKLSVSLPNQYNGDLLDPNGIDWSKFLAHGVVYLEDQVGKIEGVIGIPKHVSVSDDASHVIIEILDIESTRELRKRLETNKEEFGLYPDVRAELQYDEETGERVLKSIEVLNCTIGKRRPDVGRKKLENTGVIDVSSDD